MIDHAKGFERRRCGHHTLDEPLNTMECFASVIDPKGSRTNKNRYVVATQDPKIRAYLRTIPGVPVIYIKRSVMIMEPMGGATERVKEREEKAKFKAGIIGSRATVTGEKRKRGENEDGESDESGEDKSGSDVKAASSSMPAKARKMRGEKGPNPLSVKKAKKATSSAAPNGRSAARQDETSEKSGKRRRVRKRSGRASSAPPVTELATTNSEAT